MCLLDSVHELGLDEDPLYAVTVAADARWARSERVGRLHGYRNAHLSVLAPVGTISFMMDCDTTGIEPDFALVKTKKTSDSGTIEIVNRTVPRGLRALGYDLEEVDSIVAYVAEHGHVIGAPSLRPEHYSVFDCAVGERSISPDGHVLMMAAVQPFISGAISKTVNVPESATVEDIERIYTDGWRLGLKALAVYRDGSKSAQPLSGKKALPVDSGPVAVESVPTEHAAPARHRLPRRRDSLTTSFTVGDTQGYLTASRFPDNGLGEIFLKFGKQGSTLAGLLDAFSISVSIGLQYGIPLDTFVAKFIGQQFEPRGVTDDEDVRMASSLLDYVFRRLALDHLPEPARQGLGVLTAAERTDPGVTPPIVASGLSAAIEAPLCGVCGARMIQAGVCFACPGCGATSGCS